MKKIPIQFLGLAERYNEIDSFQLELPNGDYFIEKSKNIIGLSDIYISQIFPIPLSSFYFVFSIGKQVEKNGDMLELVVESEDGVLIATINFTLAQVAPVENTELDYQGQINALKVEDGLIKDPGVYKVYLLNKGQKLRIGAFTMYFQKIDKLTSVHKNLIKQDPFLSKNVKYQISCKECSDCLKIYTAIERNDIKNKGYLWYEDIPDEFICECNKGKTNLRYIKNNFQALLGKRSILNGFTGTFSEEFERRELLNIRNKFFDLIENETITESPREEKIQKFIESNPITLHCFTPLHILHKKRIGKEITDFVVLNQKKELILIEIEKPSTNLFKTNGGQHSALTAGFDQVKSWLREMNNNRYGVLKDMNIPGITGPDDISGIRGVLIAGRARDENFQHVSCLMESSSIEFYTFDDLISSLSILARQQYNLSSK